jgi:hypothetical protein
MVRKIKRQTVYPETRKTQVSQRQCNRGAEQPIFIVCQLRGEMIKEEERRVSKIIGYGPRSLADNEMSA